MVNALNLTHQKFFFSELLVSYFSFKDFVWFITNENNRAKK